MAKPRTPRPPQYPQRRGGKRRAAPRVWVYVAVAAVLVLAAVAAAALLALRDGGTALEPSDVTAGVQQDGVFLGASDAPVTMVEYGDLQCPACRQFALDVLPELVDRYIRPGDVRLEFRGLAFIGEDSRKALEHVLASAEFDKAWDVADLLFRNQGVENSGWVTDELLADVEEASGLDPDRIAAGAQSAEVERTMAEDAASATRLGINSTPSFLIGPAGGELRRIVVQALTIEEFVPIIDAELADAR